MAAAAVSNDADDFKATELETRHQIVESICCKIVSSPFCSKMTTFLSLLPRMTTRGCVPAHSYIIHIHPLGFKLKSMSTIAGA